MTQMDRNLDIAPADFFVLRTPLLPFEELEGWTDGLEALTAATDDPQRLAEALAADRKRLRERLRELVARPEIHDALFVASPTLVRRGLKAWLAKPDSKKGRRAEESLVRYVQRMITRPTPFGMFSGCTVGTVDSANRLGLSPRAAYQRHTRLDTGYLFALCDELGRDPQVRQELRYRPNSSLYKAAGRWRYAEARRRNGRRTHHLVAVDAVDYLDRTLERARSGATLEELAQALVADDPEISLEEAVEFVTELIDGQLLVDDLDPPITGPGPMDQVLDHLVEVPAADRVRSGLSEARKVLAGIDAGGLGADPKSYVALSKSLEKLPAKVTLSRLYQVDMIKPGADITLGSDVLEEITRGVELLWRLSEPVREDDLSRFCQEFNDRYEMGRTVPLVEVLDEEIGIGFQRSTAAGAEATPLLKGLALSPQGGGDPMVPWGAAEQFLLRKFEAARSQGDFEIDLEQEDLAPLGTERLRPMPDSFQVVAMLTASSAEHLENGDFEVLVDGTWGPSGMQYLGRFCHADDELRRRVEEQLRIEEALNPDAVFAEIVHVGEGRIGNVLARPAMRDHEIQYLGRGDAPHRIPVTDLLVTVRGGRIILHSASLGRRVIPRLTSAHSYGNGLGVYRFLGALQSQGVCRNLSWRWGPLAGLPFLPRVRSGRVVLSRASWLLTQDDINRLTDGDATERFRAYQTLRRDRGVPAKTVLADGDHHLLVDAANTLSVESLLTLATKRNQLFLTEFYPGPDQLCAQGPEGRFTHELVVPFVQRKPAPPRETPLPPVNAGVRRIFPPGSEWLYVKLYTGSSTADQVLRELVGPLTRQVLATGAADRWYFLRYGDPHWHLRLRFHRDPGALREGVLAPLQSAAARWVDAGQIWRVQIDTYEREIERYGGAEGIEFAEHLAHVDSQAVLEIVDSLEGDEGATARWRLALRGVDLLLDDLGLEGDGKLAVAKSMREAYAREFGIGKAGERRLGDRLREERPNVEGLFDSEWDAEHPLAPGFAALARRSQRMAPLAAELRAHEAANRLTVPVPELAASYVHMFINRLMRSEARTQEVVLHDFLHRTLMSRRARARHRANKNKRERSS